MAFDVKTYSGRGKVLMASVPLADVEYSIQISQKSEEGTTLDGKSYSIPGFKEIDGHISCGHEQIQQMLAIKNLTLQMQGGEKLDFELLDSSGRILAGRDLY